MQISKPAEEKNIVEYMKSHQHLSVATCATTLKVTKQRIYTVLRRNGVSRSQFKGLGQNAYRIIALLQNTRLSHVGISEKIGVHRERVGAVAKDAAFNGIKFRKRGK